MNDDLVKYSRKMKQKPKTADLFEGMVGDSKIPVYVTEKASEINQQHHLDFCLKRDFYLEKKPKCWGIDSCSVCPDKYTCKDSAL